MQDCICRIRSFAKTAAVNFVGPRPNDLRALNPRLQEIHAAVPHLRTTIVNDMVADDQGRLPYVYRREELYGYLNGVLSTHIGPRLPQCHVCTKMIHTHIKLLIDASGC